MTDSSEPIEITRDDIRQAMHELEALGLIRKTGELRRGRPVYVVTERGRTAAQFDVPDPAQQFRLTAPARK